nr:DNA repair protein REV1 isoform X1 [Pogona vitticeps]XP_020661264.1 DNA repair protein REV1 isoform X1 [Pogona vitticeps]XP_020661265.1 DNA repair protein REV1 isoform X1 [Pogona vitticeps]XP_020661266.1 DNA repair protein REV1 isoform X1 [Pogona vitticeps]
MKQGGWQKRASNRDGWGPWGGYMSAKVQKLEDQFRSDAAMQLQKDGTSSSIFSGVAIYVNGYTDPSADELRQLMMLHGGQYHVYYSRSQTTHIIATNLPNAKIKELKREKVVRPEWITDSIKAGQLLSYIPYQLYTKQSSIQKGLRFNTICKPEDPVPGPSNTSVELNRVNCLVKKYDNEIKANGMSRLKKEEETEDEEFSELEQAFSGSKQNGIHHRDSFSIFNGNTHSSSSALKTQDSMVPSGHNVTSRLSPGPVQEDERREIADFRDCSMQHFQQSNKNTELLQNVHRTMSNSSFSSLHSNIKINGAHHSTVQGPSSTKSTTSVSAPSKVDSSPLSKSSSSFISDFYSHSRLHHISTWKCEFTEFVNTLQRRNSAIFPGREKLKKLKAGQSTVNKTNSDNISILNSTKHQSCIMHVDMDCFFVSVGIRDRPDLKGKPVAVTSNRGSGKALLRPGANPQLEWQYYQNKLLNGKAETDELSSTDEDNQDSAQVNGVDFDLSVPSMAEIASCSYEARQAGVRNGMFFGQAKRLCPNLQAVPYDFQAYKEVAKTMYETLASYTYNIEAVSCDEALVDITELLQETGLTSEELAHVIRTEIKNKTKCPASIGISSNILLARMATRQAKPDGQYHLKSEEVDDFIRSQLIINLPGVGRTMESKLSSLGVKTCGDLQCVTMSKLQKEFGPKTGQMLYRFCRGLDDRPVQREKKRKSVSAEINYGIRFTQPQEAEAFLLSLSEEIQCRLEAAGMKGKRLTLKVMIRKAGAPIEPAKFGGHGICDTVARTVTLNDATDSAKVIGKETLNMFHTMKLNISDMRGVGIQVNQLIPVNKTTLAVPSHSLLQSGSLPGGSNSITDFLQAPKIMKNLEQDHKKVFVAPVDVKISTTSKAHTTLPSLTSNVSHVTSKSSSEVNLNGLHPPTVIKSKLNISIEVPPPSQLDQSVLEALPSDLQEQIQQMYSLQQAETGSSSKKEPVNGYNTTVPQQPVGAVLLQIPDLKESSGDMGINVIALPAFSQVDPEVFAALPAELQAELRQAYDQRQKHTENVFQYASATVSKNPLLNLKPFTKSKKKSRGKNQVSPVKKHHSPLKNKLFGSPSKNTIASAESPQKLMDDYLKQEGKTTDNSQVELMQATIDTSSPSVSQPLLSAITRPQAPNLAGAVEFSDVKALLREWITTISDPMEEDILQVVKYCTDLIEEKDLEKLDLVIKYMKRLMQQSVESVWNMAFDFILDNVQVVLQQTYGSTLKVI